MVVEAVGARLSAQGLFGHADIERDDGSGGERGRWMPREADERHVEPGEDGDKPEQFLGFAGVREREDQIAAAQHAEIAVQGFDRMQEAGGRAGGVHGGDDLAGDDAGFAETSDGDAVARSCCLRDQREGVVERAAHLAVDAVGEAGKCIGFHANEAGWARYGIGGACSRHGREPAIMLAEQEAGLSLEQLATGGFESQQERLVVQPSAKAGELARGSDDAVTRHHDRDWILSVGRAYGPGGVGIAELFSDIEIASGFSEGDRQQSGPDNFLEGRSDEMERKRKRFAFAGEVLFQLLLRLEEYGMLVVSDEVIERDDLPAAVVPEDSNQALAVGDQLQGADRRGDGFISELHVENVPA